MDVAVKYCGGCNPMFDRAGFAEKLREALPGISVQPFRENADADYLVVICGCRRACALHEGLSGRYGKYVVTDSADYESLFRSLRVAANQKNNAGMEKLDELERTL